MENQNLQQLRVVFDILDRRKGLITFFLFLGISIGLAFYLVQPKIYRAAALLSYQKQEITTEKRSHGSKAKIEEIVSTLSQIVTSRTSLEKIIVDEKLYLKKRAEVPMEDVVDLMRENISIQTSKEGDTFLIAFTGDDANQVVRVANGLSARFIEENLKYREERASEASVYTQDELNMTKEMLDQKETVMRDYKLKHYNEMPENLAINISRLNAIQSQYQLKQESIQDLERTKVLIREQLVAHRQLMASGVEQISEDKSDQPPTNIDTSRYELLRAQEQLRRFQVRYTEQHPKIKRLKRKIAELEASLSQVNSNDENQSGNANKSFDKVLFGLELQLKGIQLNVDKLQREREMLQKQIEESQKWIDAAPVREAEWTALTREYDQIKRRYDFLVGQNLQAKSALNLERKQKGSQFKIEDPARKTTKPVKPDFIKIMAAALVAGLASGGVIAFGLNMLDSSFQNPDSLEQIVGIPVICSVPKFELRKETIKKRVVSVSKIVFFLVWFGAILVVVFYFWKTGRIIF